MNLGWLNHKQMIDMEPLMDLERLLGATQTINLVSLSRRLISLCTSRVLRQKNVMAEPFRHQAVRVRNKLDCFFVRGDVRRAGATDDDKTSDGRRFDEKTVEKSFRKNKKMDNSSTNDSSPSALVQMCWYLF